MYAIRSYYGAWQEEPAWGRVVVIRGFSVAEHYRQWQIVDRLEVVIPVTFEVVGAVYMESAGFVPEPGVEEIRVRVKSVRNRWRIVEPVLPPHVGLKRMIPDGHARTQAPQRTVITSYSIHYTKLYEAHPSCVRSSRENPRPARTLQRVLHSFDTSRPAKLSR